MSVRKLFSNGIWLIFGSAISNAISFLYVFIISQSVRPEVVGSLGVIMALQAAIGVFLSLGIPTGIQLLVGAARGKEDSEEIKSIFLPNIIALAAINAIGTIFLVMLSFTNIWLLNLSPSELLLIASVHILSSVSPILLALFIALLQSRVAAFAQIVSSVMKIPIAIVTLAFAQDILAACLGIIVSYLVLDILLIYQWKRKVGIGSKSYIHMEHFRQAVKAGRPSWTIAVLTTLGESLGVILIFNVSGSLSTGLYYIAYAVASVVLLIPASILGVLFPLLSGMVSGKEDAAAGAIRLGMVTTVPIAITLITYPEMLLSILGADYIFAAPILRLLLIGALFSSITVGYNSYVYSERKFRKVVMLGLSINITRLSAYFPLVILASGIGAASAYSAGILAGVLSVILFSRKDKLRMEWYTYVKILLPPILTAVFLSTLQIHFIVGIPILLLLALFSYARMNVLTKTDLSELSGILFTPGQIHKLLIYFRPIVNLMFGN